MKTKIINYLFLLTNQAGIAFMAFAALGLNSDDLFNPNGILFFIGWVMMGISILFFHWSSTTKFDFLKKAEIILLSSVFELMLSLLPTGIMAIVNNDIPFGVMLTAACITSMVIFLPYDIIVKQTVMKKEY